ncbi:MAG: HU family DNA-binding protein [Alphaproteobacteria bacterium]|nr:HU family DNA-binding protein [Alphaproteobacteria bacterium]
MAGGGCCVCRDRLAQGDDVRLPGFSSFVARPARAARNLRTGAILDIPARLQGRQAAQGRRERRIVMTVAMDGLAIGGSLRPLAPGAPQGCYGLTGGRWASGVRDLIGSALWRQFRETPANSLMNR